MLPQGIEPAVEAALLRGVLDSQPVCLIRLGTDGVVLAADDAALALVGAKDLGEVLGKVFTSWVLPEHHIPWRMFLQQVTLGTSASIQCDLVSSSGTRHTTLLHGMPLDDHADGIRSIAVAARESVAPYVPDVSTGAHRQEENGSQSGPPPGAGGDDAERRRLEAMVRDLEGRLQELTAEYESARYRFEQAAATGKPNGRSATDLLDEQQILVAIRETSVWHQLEASIAERESVLLQLEQDLAEARTALERSQAESQRLAREWTAERAKLETLVADARGNGSPAHVAPPAADNDRREHERQLLQEQARQQHERQEQEWREREQQQQATLAQLEADCGALRGELERAIAERERVGTALHALEARQQKSQDEHIEQIGGLRQRLETALAGTASIREERDQLVARLESDLADTRAALEEARLERERLDEERRAASSPDGQASAAADAAAAASSKSSQPAEAARAMLAAAVRDTEAQLQRLVAVQALERARIEERTSAAALEHQAELAEARQTADARLQASDEVHARLMQERETELASAASALEQARIDTRRLERQVESLESRERELAARHAAERADLERLFDALAAQHESDLQAAQRQAEELCLEAARAEIDASRDESARLSKALAESQTDREQLAAQAGDLRGQLERRLADLVAEHDAAMSARQAAADEREREDRSRQLALETQHADLTHQLEALAGERASLLQSHESLLQERHALQQNRELLEQQAEAARRDRQTLEDQHDIERAATATTIQDLRAQLESERQAAGERERAAASAVEAIEERLRAEGAAGAAALERATRLDQELTAFKARNDSHAAEHKALDQRLKAAAKDHQSALDKARQAAEGLERDAAREREALQEQLEGERAKARAELEEAHATLSQALAERQRLDTVLQELRDDVRERDERHGRDRAALVLQLERSAADYQAELRSAHDAATLAASQAASQAATDREALEARLQEERTIARAELQQTRGQGQLLESLVADLRSELHQLESAHQADRQQLETALHDLQARHTRELRAAAQTAQQRSQDAVQVNLEQLLDDRRQMESALRDLETRQQRLAASRAAEHGRIEELEQELAAERRATHAREQEFAATLATLDAQLKHAAAIECDQARIARIEADQRVALQALAEHARRLAPLAAAGRVARAVAADLRDASRDLDERASRLLVECPVTGFLRTDLERLRADAIAVSTLAAELLDPAGSTSESDRTPDRARVSRSGTRR